MRIRPRRDKKAHLLTRIPGYSHLKNVLNL